MNFNRYAILVSAVAAAGAQAQITIGAGELGFEPGDQMLGSAYYDVIMDLGPSKGEPMWDFTADPGGIGPVTYRSEFYDGESVPVEVADAFPPGTVFSVDFYGGAPNSFMASTYTDDRALFLGLSDAGVSIVFQKPLVDWPLPLSEGVSWSRQTTFPPDDRLAWLSGWVDATGSCTFFDENDVARTASCLRIRSDIQVGDASLAFTRFTWVARGEDGAHFVAAALGALGVPTTPTTPIDVLILLDASPVTPVLDVSWGEIKARFTTP